MLVALTAALGVAACGSSSNNTSSKTTSKSASTTTTKSGSANSASRTAFTACLKQHGVTLPAHGPGGFGGGTGTGTTATPPSGTSTTRHRFGPGGGGGFSGGGFAAGNSKFAKAFRACGSKLGSGAGNYARGRFPVGGGPRAGRVHFATAALKAFVACVRKNGYAAMPEPNKSGKFPPSVEKNAKFQAASVKCVSVLRPGIHAQGQSTTSTSSSAASA
jgi:hypothetical protein